MPGSLLIAKKVSFRNIVQKLQFKMILLSMSVGVMSGLFIALVRLNLGMPGHKAFFWMTPILITRLHSKCKIGATSGGLFAALTTYSLGANLAGGVIGMPIVVIAAIILDWTANLIEKNDFSGAKMILILGIAGAVANLVCLSKRMILPAGLNPHFIFGVSGFWFRLCSYAFFGLLSGVAAAISVKLKVHKRLHEDN